MRTDESDTCSIRVGQDKVIIDRSCVARLRAEFAETGIAFLPGFISSAVRDLLMKQLRSTSFQMKDETRSASGAVFGTTRKVLEADPIMTGMHFALNRPELFHLVSEITGIPMPGNFVCRIHSTEASPEQHIDWHDDQVDERILGLNINLSDGPFGGGLFQLRGPDRVVRGQVHFHTPGDAFLFRIGSGWQHRLTRVESGIRTVAVGWFRRRPNWQTMALAGFYNGKLILSESI